MEETIQEESPRTNGGATPITALASVNGALTDISAYQRGLVRREWIPDDSSPELKFTLWIRVKALTGSDQSLIQNKVNQLEIRGARLNRLRQQLQHLKPDSRVERNEATLRRMSVEDDEWKDKEEEYYDRREKLQSQVDEWMRAYADQSERLQSEIESLLAEPNFYRTLATDFFDKVIEDHTIGIPLERGGPLVKLDFKSDDPRMELSDDAAAGLQEFLWDVIKKESRAEKKKSRR